jgi:hypothetical protein
VRQNPNHVDRPFPLVFRQRCISLRLPREVIVMNVQRADGN